MRFSDTFLDEVVARNDIADVVSSYVTLTRKGSNLFGLCPFHNEKTPSFSVAPDKQIYHCFGCKKGGSVINFIMEIEGLSFPEAVAFLAKRANLPLPAEEEQTGADRMRRRVLELNRTAARWYYEQLQQPQGAAVQSYLDRRQIRKNIAVRFGMGASLNEWDALTHAMRAKGYSKVPQPADAAGHRQPGRCGGLRQPRDRQFLAKVHEHHRDGGVQQAAGAVRAESGEENETPQHHPVRRQSGRGDTASGGL